MNQFTQLGQAHMPYRAPAAAGEIGFFCCVKNGAGAWKLRAGNVQTPGIPYLRLRGHLDQIDSSGIALVAYEDVKRHGRPGQRGGSNTAAAQAYGGARAILWTWAGERGLDYVGVAVGSIKKAALGKGGGKGTGKAEMMAAAEARWPRFAPWSEDAADAAFVGVAASLAVGLRRHAS